MEAADGRPGDGLRAELHVKIDPFSRGIRFPGGRPAFQLVSVLMPATSWLATMRAMRSGGTRMWDHDRHPNLDQSWRRQSVRRKMAFLSGPRLGLQVLAQSTRIPPGSIPMPRGALPQLPPPRQHARGIRSGSPPGSPDASPGTSRVPSRLYRGHPGPRGAPSPSARCADYQPPASSARR